MASDDKPEGNAYPESAHGEFGYSVARLSLNVGGDLVLPGLGTTAALFVDRFIGNPVEKRRAEFFNLLAQGLSDLQLRLGGFDFRTLGQNEEFISVVAFAAGAATRTHREEKREALCNAALNMAAGNTLDDILVGTFLALIDRYTVHHIAIARLLAAPRDNDLVLQHCELRGYCSIADAVAAALPDVPRASVEQAILDVCLDNITQSNYLSEIKSSEVLAKQTTARGDAFIRFISSPIPS